MAIAQIAAVVQLLNHVWLFCNPMDCTYQASLRGIPRQEMLEWVAISFSKGSSWPGNQTQVSCLTDRLFTTEPPEKAVPWLAGIPNAWQEHSAKYLFHDQKMLADPIACVRHTSICQKTLHVVSLKEELVMHIWKDSQREASYHRSYFRFKHMLKWDFCSVAHTARWDHGRR